MRNNIGQSYVLFLKNIFNFKGRTRRSDFWHVILVNSTISLLLELLSVNNDFMSIFTYIISLVILVCSISLFVRRLHDIGKSGYWYLIQFVPIISTVFYFVWYTKDSQKGINKYGPNPKETMNPQDVVNVVDNKVSLNCCSVCGAIYTVGDLVCQKCGSSLQEDSYYG